VNVYTCIFINMIYHEIDFPWDSFRSARSTVTTSNDRSGQGPVGQL
jgi:hypothetical protein